MGSETRKQYLYLDNQVPIVSHTIMQFDICDTVHEIVLVIPRGHENYCREHIIDPFSFTKKIHLIEGGATRQESVMNGLKLVQNKTNHVNKTIVMIHDGVRPFVDQNIIENCIHNAVEHGACIPAVKITDTVKQVFENRVVEQTISRKNLYRAQTPQAFQLDLLLKAYDHAKQSCFSGTDDASVIEHFGHNVYVTNGASRNIKITTPEDL